MNNKYLEIPGTFLVPGFCIYLLEIKRNQDKWFYVGMTGDPHYPSARAAFHRISGHLELTRRSTQNQLRLALEKLGIVSDDDYRQITIKMYHFPIDGFKRLTEDQLNAERVKELKLTDGYKEYKKAQRKVLALENALIFELQDKLLNKTPGVALRSTEIPYQEIYKQVVELVRGVARNKND